MGVLDKDEKEFLFLVNRKIQFLTCNSLIESKLLLKIRKILTL